MDDYTPLQVTAKLYKMCQEIITILKSVNDFIKWRFSESNILLASDLIKYDFRELKERTKIPDEILKRIIDEARQVYRVRVKSKK